MKATQNLKVQWGLAVPVAGRNSSLRQSGNHAQMGLISAKVHLREMTFTNEMIGLIVNKVLTSIESSLNHPRLGNPTRSCSAGRPAVTWNLCSWTRAPAFRRSLVRSLCRSRVPPLWPRLISNATVYNGGGAGTPRRGGRVPTPPAALPLRQIGCHNDPQPWGCCPNRSAAPSTYVPPPHPTMPFRRSFSYPGCWK